MWYPNNRRTFKCPDCLTAKARAGSHAKTRPPENQPRAPLQDLATDFLGKISPPSWRDKNFVMVFIDE